MIICYLHSADVAFGCINQLYNIGDFTAKSILTMSLKFEVDFVLEKTTNKIQLCKQLSNAYFYLQACKLDNERNRFLCL